MPLLAAAALLALVTFSVLLVSLGRPAAPRRPAAPMSPRGRGGGGAGAGLAAAGQQHLERSKLVVLGLAGRDADETAMVEWHYERELASRLLDDTRLYRQAAERAGLSSMADVMRDLEFVLLQASLDRRAPAIGADPDPARHPQARPAAEDGRRAGGDLTHDGAVE
jgi:hypothetical protein